MRLLVCSDPLNPSMPDSSFEAEIDAIRTVGLTFELLDVEALFAGSATRAVRRVSDDAGQLVYRGWMVTVANYEDLTVALAQRGATLITSPASYAATHHLPLAYQAIEAYTPRTVWIAGSAPFDMNEVHEALAPFGSRPIVLKDYVKSRKHEWLEACFIPSASDRAAVERVVNRFAELQGDDLAGGLVFREFVELEPVGTHSRSGLPLGREYRLFFVDGRFLAGGRYWDDVDYPDEFPTEPFATAAATLPSRFLSMDIAKTRSGEWIVMEVGDGQVSGLPDSIRALDFYARLATAVT